jgi:hypothetical protein
MNIVKSTFTRPFIRSATYWHGTSEAAVGSEQLQKREFDRDIDSRVRYLWAVDEKNKAATLKYARRSAANTGSQAILLKLKSDQCLENVPYEHHDLPALNPHVARIHILEVEYLTEPASFNGGCQADGWVKSFQKRSHNNQD